MINALRGMKDILPPQNEKFEYFIKNASKIAKNYGFEYVETPILEETNLFKRSVGESSDIVGKEMYEFVDKGGNSVCLRPEGTAGVVRSFIQNKYDRAGGVKRFFYHGPMFRYERPQKGRLREFHQFGVECFGESSPYEDVNIILMLKDILDFFGIKYTLKINTLGCEKCLPPFRENLVDFLTDIEEGLCDDCKRRIKTNPIRVFDCKNENCQKLLQNAPRLGSELCDECKESFEFVKSKLDNLGVEYEVDSNLVRGLDYYTKTAFEFVSKDIGAQNAVAGGGRYDRLVEFLGGRATPGIGFAIGIERLLDLIEIEDDKKEGYYLGAMDENALDLVFEIANKKRKKEKVAVSYGTKSLKAHLKTADKNGMRYCAVIGENELKEGKIWVKDLVEKKENLIDIDKFKE
ncbi:MAG: histidine--tRNA ligase [Epsilonproteobacteria bacterium]|nr:histidine--tRNA ligase [Campylobacterota bacterium]